MDLLDAMEHALYLAPNKETLDVKKLRSLCEGSAYHQRTIVQMMNLIVECGYFIQTYLMDINFCNEFFSAFVILIY